MSEERDLQEFAPSVREVHDRFVEATERHRPALWDYCLRRTGSPWPEAHRPPPPRSHG